MTRRLAPHLVPAALLLLLAGCGGTSAHPAGDGGPGDDAAPDGSGPSTDDGTPVRQACTDQLGSALTTAHGRLDGYLRAIVQPGHGSCNADSDHVHLQVEAQGAIYDVAVTVASSQTGTDVLYREWDGPLPTMAWSEGWHPIQPLDYVITLGLHSDSFVATPKAQLAQQVTAALDGVNHVSIYGTGYGPDGMHLVHRNSGLDGAVIVRPLAATPHFLLFGFVGESF